MKYIDTDKLKEKIYAEDTVSLAHGSLPEFDQGCHYAFLTVLSLIDSLQQEQDLIVINKKDWEAQEQFQKNKDFGKPIQQEQPDKESLNESQQEFVNIVTERMLKEGPIPTLKGKQKAEFEKEFNRFKQITGMINFPAHMEVYKRVILWFMAWGADNLPNLNKATNSDELDFQQEQSETDLDADIEMEWDSFNKHLNESGEESEDVVWLNWNSFADVARNFYELGLKSK